jgi:hypothetical protein
MLADNRRKSMNQISVDLREKMPSIILSKAHKLTANEQQSNPSSIQEKRKNQIFCFREFDKFDKNDEDSEKGFCPYQCRTKSK